jgi:hypothetical protein
VDFSLQDTGGSGWGSVSESFGGNGDTGYDSSGITSTLENIGVNFAAGAASVGLNALGKSAGVSSPYGYSSPSILTRPPGSLPTYGAGVGGNGVVLVGVLLGGGLLLFAAFGRKG